VHEGLFGQVGIQAPHAVTLGIFHIASLGQQRSVTLQRDRRRLVFRLYVRIFSALLQPRQVSVAKGVERSCLRLVRLLHLEFFASPGGVVLLVEPRLTKADGD